MAPETNAKLREILRHLSDDRYVMLAIMPAATTVLATLEDGQTLRISANEGTEVIIRIISLLADITLAPLEESPVETPIEPPAESPQE